MTLLWVEGFDNITASATTGVPKGCTSAAGSFNSSYGRFGSMGYQPPAASATVWDQFGAQTTLIVGAAVRVAAFTGSASGYYFAFLDNASGAQLTVMPNVFGAIEVRLGTGTGTLIASSPIGTVQSNVFGYLEMKATLDDTSGICVVRWNGVEVINYTGDTRSAGAATTWDKVYFYGNGLTLNVDDLYIANTAGSAPNNNFLGDVRVVTLYPNANGNSSQGTGSDANSVDNYALVDEAPAPATADYVDLTAGEKDTYGYQDVSGFASGLVVHGVQVSSYVAKSDAGTISAAHVARFSATETTSTPVAMPSTAAWMLSVLETKPGGGAWTSLADLNATEFGVVAS